MAQHVVHGSKLVQVQHHQALALFTPGLYALIELVHQGRAVGQGQLAVYKRIAAQLGHQIDVLGPQRNVGTENLQQFFVHVANGRGRGDVGGKTFVFRLAEVQGDAARLDDAAVAFQRLHQRAYDGGVVNILQALLNEVTKIARRRNHPEIAGQVGAGGFFRGRADHTLRVHADQAGNLRDDAFGKRAQALFGTELVAGRDDFFQPPPVGVQPQQLVVRTNGSRKGGEQLVLRQLALGLVVVDVVACNRVCFRRMAGLAGAQNDARVQHLELLTDHAHGAQASVIAFHHHVEQDDSDVPLALQQLQRLAGRMRVQQLQRPPQDQQVRQRETGGLVHILVVIHDQYAPGLQICGIPRAIFAVVQEYQIVVRCHHASTSPSACY